MVIYIIGLLHKKSFAAQEPNCRFSYKSEHVLTIITFTNSIKTTGIANIDIYKLYSIITTKDTDTENIIINRIFYRHIYIYKLLFSWLILTIWEWETFYRNRHKFHTLIHTHKHTHFRTHTHARAHTHTHTHEHTHSNIHILHIHIRLTADASIVCFTLKCYDSHIAVTYKLFTLIMLKIILLIMEGELV